MKKEKNSAAGRDTVIVRTSLTAIAANVALAAVKAVTGFLTNSIAVVLDAVNNLSDAVSSVVTIIGARLASRNPDKKHPLGHGRAEYLSAMIVAAIVLYAGITALVESVKKIFRPETATYSTVSLVIIAVAVAVKIILGNYVRRMGKKVNSASLVASGTDALSDAILSASVLASALIYVFFGVSLEAYVGAVIAVFIIRSGIGMLADTFDDILGKRVDREFLSSIRETILRDPDVRGVYDLILHSYGPDRYVGSVHVEIADTMTADGIDSMERRIAGAVYAAHGVILAGIGIYAFSTDSAVDGLRSAVMEFVNSFDGVMQVHGFYADMENNAVSLDVILDYSLSDRDEIYKKICAGLPERFPGYSFTVTQDIDV